MKTYQFSLDELLVLREAMAEYKQFIKPPSGVTPSERRISNYNLSIALLEQFTNDVRKGINP